MSFIAKRVHEPVGNKDDGEGRSRGEGLPAASVDFLGTLYAMSELFVDRRRDDDGPGADGGVRSAGGGPDRAGEVYSQKRGEHLSPHYPLGSSTPTRYETGSYYIA